MNLPLLELLALPQPQLKMTSLSSSVISNLPRFRSCRPTWSSWFVFIAGCLALHAEAQSAQSRPPPPPKATLQLVDRLCPNGLDIVSCREYATGGGGGSAAGHFDSPPAMDEIPRAIDRLLNGIETVKPKASLTLRARTEHCRAVKCGSRASFGLCCLMWLIGSVLLSTFTTPTT